MLLIRDHNGNTLAKLSDAELGLDHARIFDATGFAFNNGEGFVVTLWVDDGDFDGD